MWRESVNDPSSDVSGWWHGRRRYSEVWWAGHPPPSWDGTPEPVRCHWLRQPPCGQPVSVLMLKTAEWSQGPHWYGRALRDMRRTLPSNRIHPGARAGKGLAGVRAELRSVGASLCWNQALLDRHIIGWLQMPREVSKIMWLKAGELLYVRHQESGQPCRG